ncbi:MAG: YbaK/EbsC family protein [Acidimicrobiales bacterium]|nr:YbaK/EbsC family protein [Actinomycetota bacterium]
MHRNVRQVVEAGKALGVDVHAREFAQGTRTAADAAEAIGVDLGQIVKSLVFGVGAPYAEGAAALREVVVALVSGENLLDEDKLARAAGAEKAWREDADTVRETTGFPVGGVPPFGHREPLRVFVDQDLLDYEELWAAAGTPHVNFAISPTALLRATGGKVCSLARR